MMVKVQEPKKRSGPGRPPKYVLYDGKPVKGLSFKPGTIVSPDGRFYSSHNDRHGRRAYFGRELDEAVVMFHKWKKRGRR